MHFQRIVYLSCQYFSHTEYRNNNVPKPSSVTDIVPYVVNLGGCELLAVSLVDAAYAQ